MGLTIFHKIFSTLSLNLGHISLNIVSLTQHYYKYVLEYIYITKKIAFTRPQGHYTTMYLNMNPIL